MSDHHDDHDQEDNQNHEDCDDCKRERAENQKLIAIYQKLQEVDKKSTDMKSSITLLHQNMLKSQNTLKSFEHKVQKIKNNNNSQQQSQFQQMGYKLYADALENQKSKSNQKQNQRLKAVLKNIYEQKKNDKKYQKEENQLKSDKCSKKQFFNKSAILPEINQSHSIQWFNQRDRASRVESRKSQSFEQTSTGKSFEIFSTKSSFHMTKRKIFEKRDFQELNLWLFDQKNQILEKQLYEKSNQINNSKKYANKGVQKYINFSKNSQRDEISSKSMKRSFRREISLGQKHLQTNYNLNNQKSTAQKFNLRMSSQNIQQASEEDKSKSSKFFSKGIKRQSILPSLITYK